MSRKTSSMQSHLLSGLGIFACLKTAAAWSYVDIPAWNSEPSSAMCQNSGDQSPIDIATAGVISAEAGLKDLEFSSNSESAVVETQTTSSTWQVIWPENSSEKAKIIWADKEYILRHFHYHSPSENKIDGQFFDLEVQHIHRSIDGQLLVVTVLLNVGSPNTYLGSFWDKFPTFPKNITSTTVLPVSRRDVTVLEPYGNFLPADKSYYHWMGSLTEPPCTNNTLWVLMKHALQLSQEQLSAYRVAINASSKNSLVVKPSWIQNGVPEGTRGLWNAELGVNNRPVQVMGERQVQFHKHSQKWMMMFAICAAATLVIMCIGVLLCKKQKGDSTETKKRPRKKKPEEMMPLTADA